MAKKHGHTKHDWQSPTYISWSMMRQRCNNPKNPKFYMYGARGISVCAQWAKFEQFLADMGERPSGTSLDRVDSGGNYEPENCRWATPREQSSHVSLVRYVPWRGGTVGLAELSRTLGLDKGTLSARIRAGWPESEWGAPKYPGARMSRRGQSV